MVGALVRDLDDLVGAKVTRKVCYAKHLDGMPGADPNKHMVDEMWIINRKTKENSTTIEFELVCPMDVQGVHLPRGIINATVCRWTVETPEVCPYVMSCGKTLDDCRAHYPEPGAKLPFGAFPGTHRY